MVEAVHDQTTGDRHFGNLLPLSSDFCHQFDDNFAILCKILHVITLNEKKSRNFACKENIINF